METLIQSKLLFPEILWKRPSNIYKRQAGKVLIIAGSRGMAGAGALCAESSFRAGAGIVVLAFPEIIIEVYKKLLPEAMSLPLPSTSSGSISINGFNEIKTAAEDSDVIVLGPGISQNQETQQLVQKILAEVKKPIILDADGINAITKNPQEYLKNTNVILTPHPGELSKLIKVKPSEIDKDKIKYALESANKFNSIIVLKGENTVITDGKKLVKNKTGGSELATAGTGDVLSGIIATFWAQNINKPLESSSTAVYLHGLSGDLAATEKGERSVIASDVIKYLPEALKKAEKETE